MITFSSDPSQKLSKIINGDVIDFELNYNTTADAWILDIIAQKRTVLGVRLVGKIDILSQHNIGFGLISKQNDPKRNDIENFILEVV